MAEDDVTQAPAPQEQTPAPLVETATPVSVQPLPSGKIVEFVQDDGSSIRLHVLTVASDGSLTLLHTGDTGRVELAGVRFDASGAVGTWHEPE